jgi:hypothetical protein
MASALCPHGWPWFEECPFCFQEAWVDGLTGCLLQAYGKLIASARALLRSSFVVVPAVVPPQAFNESTPEVEVDWFLLDAPPGPLSFVLSDADPTGALNSGGGREPVWDSYQPASGMAHPSVGKE